MVDIVPTRSALMELRDEQGVMREGHAFLDEKRVLLASELVRQLKHHDALKREFDARYAEAGSSLRRAVQRHGLEGVAAYPAAASAGELRERRRGLLGVMLQEARLEIDESRQSRSDFGSPEGEQCKTNFRLLLEGAASLAAVAGNIQRLFREYRRTERRTRALEDVIIPELDASIKVINDVLEAQELEEAIRVRIQTRR